MNSLPSRLALLALMCAGGSGAALAQAPGLPTTQPALVTIIREDVKVGRAADHARIEAGWPAAFARTKSPDYYLTIVSTKFSRDGLLNSETNRFRLDPKQSYVSAETRATDPAFWGPPPAPARPRTGTATRP
ncbi:MAG: hypothetical protein WD773_08035 [Gemmatimonadales bacterium]